MIKGVIFDLDGVIIDSPKIYFKVMKEGLNFSKALEKYCTLFSSLKKQQQVHFVFLQK